MVPPFLWPPRLPRRSTRIIPNNRVVTWSIIPNTGLETSWIELSGSRLVARGRALGRKPVTYWLDYELETGAEFVTHVLRVKVEVGNETRRLELSREGEIWAANGEKIPELTGALDCDLGLCPLTNTMPILRHDLHTRPGRHDFLMAWVAVPELTVHPSRQTYTHLNKSSDGAQVRYESGDFTSDLRVDRDGLVVEYPQLATRVSG